MLNFLVGTYGFFMESNMEYGTPPVGLIFFGLLENGVREVNLPPSGEVQFAPGEFAAETEAQRNDGKNGNFVRIFFTKATPRTCCIQL